MATGNHFWLDCLAGAVVALVAMAIVYKWDAIRGLAVRPRRERATARAALRPDTAATVRSHVSKAAAIKDGYTAGARSLAPRSMGGLARTRVTPNALTASGVTLCAVASIVVLFEHRNEMLFYWVGAALFVAGSVLDILDGALARAGGKSTPFGAFLDSTTDRVSEGFMLAAIAYVFARREPGRLRRRRGRLRSPARSSSPTPAPGPRRSG